MTSTILKQKTYLLLLAISIGLATIATVQQAATTSAGLKSAGLAPVNGTNELGATDSGTAKIDNY